MTEEQFKIKVEIKDDALRRLLKEMETRKADLTPAMKEVGEIVRSSIIKNFQEGGRPAWIPSKRARTKGGKTLRLTGRLQNSIAYKAHRRSVEVGTNVIYGRIHQLGGKAGRGLKVTIPARPYLMVQDEDWPEITKAISDYLMEAAK